MVREGEGDPVTLAFCSFQQNFIKVIRANFGIPNLPQPADGVIRIINMAIEELSFNMEESAQ